MIMMADMIGEIRMIGMIDWWVGRLHRSFIVVIILTSYFIDDQLQFFLLFIY